MVKLHILPNPCGITNPKYTIDPFNIAVHKFIKNMKGYGWDMIHYGHEDSDVDCEHVTVLTKEDRPIPQNDQEIIWKNKEAIEKFNLRASVELSKRKSPNDLILNFYGEECKYTMDFNSDLRSVEPSIGYDTDCVSATYRGFTSYSQMHYFYGRQGMLMNPSWYDQVIPNAFTVSDFDFAEETDDVYGMMGRLGNDKGVGLAMEMTKHTGKKLLIAGPKEHFFQWNDTVPDHVTLLGYLNKEERRKFLSSIKALIAPSHYLEPFGNMVVEAALSGTPSITSDWGGFAETVIDGVTGYRCNDFQGFVDAINNIDSIDRMTCRVHAIQRYSDEVVHEKFHRWLSKIVTADFYNVRTNESIQ
jgi:glycosyltransferase involved in cell wall biosynthesis